MTRSKKQLDTYLIESASEFKKDKLPKNIDMLKELVFIQDGSKTKLNPLIKVVVKKAMEIWSTVGLPTFTEKTCTKKLTNLYYEWKKVKYLKNGDIKQQKEEEFMMKLNQLFEIGSKNESLDDDLMQFLEDQRSDKPVRVVKDIKKVHKPKKIQSDDDKTAPKTRGRKRKLDQDGSTKDYDSSSTASAEQEPNSSSDEVPDGPSESKKMRKSSETPTEE